MRHPLIHSSRSRLGHGIVLDGDLLERLVELADSTVAAAEDGHAYPVDTVYAQGVRDALGWLAGHHSPDRLADLLDIDPDQR